MRSSLFVLALICAVAFLVCFCVSLNALVSLERWAAEVGKSFPLPNVRDVIDFVRSAITWTFVILLVALAISLVVLAIEELK